LAPNSSRDIHSGLYFRWPHLSVNTPHASSSLSTNTAAGAMLHLLRFRPPSPQLHGAPMRSEPRHAELRSPLEGEPRTHLPQGQDVPLPPAVTALGRRWIRRRAVYGGARPGGGRTPVRLACARRDAVTGRVPRHHRQRRTCRRHLPPSARTSVEVPPPVVPVFT
jgi:hypothetical protein